MVGAALKQLQAQEWGNETDNDRRHRRGHEGIEWLRCPKAEEAPYKCRKRRIDVDIEQAGPLMATSQGRSGPRRTVPAHPGD